MKTKKKKISTSLLGACILFAILLSVPIGIIGYFTYNNAMKKASYNYAKGILNYIVSEIEPVEFKEAIDTSTRNSEIERIEGICDRFKQTHNIEYLYIVVPINTEENDNLKYVLTGESLQDRNDGYRLDVGSPSGNEYSPLVAGKFLDAMKNNDIYSFANNTEFGYMLSYLQPIKDKDNNPIAIIAADINMKDVINTRLGYIFLVFSFTLLATIIFTFLMYRWLSKRIIKPISLIENSAYNFVNESHETEDFTSLNYIKPDIKTNDEIESLSDSIDTMASDLKKSMITYLNSEKEKQRISSELSVATHIQSSMLPCIFPPYPNDKRFDIYASMNPAKEVGGDFYDFFMIDDKHLAIIVADVSGKGVPAALFMVIGKTLIKDHTKVGVNLSEVFGSVNNKLCEANSEGLFITAFEAIINVETGRVHYVNAGHEQPFIYKKGKGFTPLIMKPGFVLAGMDDMKFKEGEFMIEKGDRIFQYTDGVTEATNIKDELFGMDRLKASLDSHADVPVYKMLSAVKKDIDAFVGEAPQFDDITMLGFEFKGPSN